jgi:hypothetical protein
MNDDGALTAAGARPSPTSSRPLAAADAELALVAALTIWEQAGADTSAAAGATIEIVDLPGALLGEADGQAVRLDSDAAGYGWFVDATPFDDGEFALVGGRELRADASGAAGRIDLLTVVVHEVGHLLGFDHGDAPQAGGVMEPTLMPRVRRLPILDGRSGPPVGAVSPSAAPARRGEPVPTGPASSLATRSSQRLDVVGGSPTSTSLGASGPSRLSRENAIRPARVTIALPARNDVLRPLTRRLVAGGAGRDTNASPRTAWRASVSTWYQSCWRTPRSARIRGGCLRSGADAADGSEGAAAVRVASTQGASTTGRNPDRELRIRARA